MALPQPILDVHAQRPELLQANTHQTDAHFLYFCCQALGPSWTLLGKSGGENGYTWPNGVRTSHDVIVRVDAGGNKAQVVDIIRAAGNGVPTEPTWGDIPPHDWRASNLPVALSQVPAPGGASPVPTPTPTPQPGPICPDPSAHRPKPVPPYPDEPGFWHAGGSYGGKVRQAYLDAFNAGKRGSPDPDWNAFVWFARPGYAIGVGQLTAERAEADFIAELRRQLGL